MKSGPVILIAVAALFMVSCSVRNPQVVPSNDTVLYSDTIHYHPVRISRSDGLLFCNDFSGSAVESALYTSSWTGTMRLFEALQELDKDQSEVYKMAMEIMSATISGPWRQCPGWRLPGETIYCEAHWSYLLYIILKSQSHTGRPLSHECVNTFNNR